MEFGQELIEGKILKRYKRFLADVELGDGEIITAHTANTGSLTTCWEPGWKVALSFHDNPKRKLKYSLELTFNGETWIGINTSLPNKLALEGILDGTITELSGYDHHIPEQKVDRSRFDWLLLKGDKEVPKERCWVEVKNVTLKEKDDYISFPDAKSERGRKHLEDLIQRKKAGDRACMLYVVQREDVHTFMPAWEIDPEYADTLVQASQAGVEILVYQCRVGPEKILIDRPMPFDLMK